MIHTQPERQPEKQSMTWSNWISLRLALALDNAHRSNDLEGQGVADSGSSEGVDCFLAAILADVDIDLQGATNQVSLVGSLGEGCS